MGVRENSLSFNTQYFNISGGGVLYQSSRDPKEGFEEHIMIRQEPYHTGGFSGMV